MLFSTAIVTHGSNAVQNYRKMSGIKADNRMPEVFLGGWIAQGLHADFGVHARVECYFTEMARDLGQVVDLDLVNEMGGWRADVAVYEEGKPTAVIELKIHDESRPEGLVLRDLTKMRMLSRRTGVEIYLGVLITDTAKELCSVRAERMGKSLGHPFDVIGMPTRADGGRAKWSWLFACGAFV